MPLPPHELLVEWIVTIRSVYHDLLNRLPDPEGMANWMDFFAAGGTGEEMTALVLGSQEYADLHPPLPPTPPFPPAPSLERKTDVRSNFLNLLDSRGKPQFSAFIGGYPVAIQNEWIQNEIKASSTHMAVTTDVNGYSAMDDADFHAVHFYAEGKHVEFEDLLTRVCQTGLIPIVFLHSGDSYPGDDYFEGICEWWNRNLAKFTDYCLFVCCWEGVNGGYSSHDFNAANLIMRRILGPRATLACHLSPGRGTFGSHASQHYPQDANGCELDDPWYGQSEPDCWKSECGPEFGVFLFQSEVAREGDVDEWGQPQWWDRTLDTAERFLPAGTPMPGAVGVKMRDRQGNLTTRDGYAGGPNGADWFGSGPRPALCFFESVAYDFIRGGCDSQRAREVASKAATFGFTRFGNGIPEWQ